MAAAVKLYRLPSPTVLPDYPAPVLWALINKLRAFEPVIQTINSHDFPEPIPQAWAELGVADARRVQLGWDEVIGSDSVKDSLKEAIVLPALFPDLFVGNRRPWNGVLLFGPPGTGKSSLVKAVAAESKVTLLRMSLLTVMTLQCHQGERVMRLTFDMAKSLAPSLIWMAEICALRTLHAGTEVKNDDIRRAKTEFLVQFSHLWNLTPRVAVIGTTEYPWHIDSSVRKRFEKRIHVTLPTCAQRKALFDLALQSVKVEQDFDTAAAAVMTQQFTGGNIVNVCHDLAMMPLRRAIQGKSPAEIRAMSFDTEVAPATMEDLRAALEVFKSDLPYITESARKNQTWGYDFT
eukprot:m.309336 g.309336  ORF g.309336 m.309336 type:complete len:348 (+) comp16371_c1_seq4:3104-4147(+)